MAHAVLHIWVSNFSRVGIVLVMNDGFHQVHLYVGRIPRLLHERIPKTPFAKQACVRLFFFVFFFCHPYSRHTHCRLIGSLQFALPFLLAFLAGKAVDTYHFHWVVLPGSAFFGMSCVFSILQTCIANIAHSSPSLFLLSFVDPESFMHVSALSYTVHLIPTNYLVFEQYSCS